MAKKITRAKKMFDSPLDKGIKSLEYGNKIFREMFNRADIYLQKVEVF